MTGRSGDGIVHTGCPHHSGTFLQGRDITFGVHGHNIRAFQHIPGHRFVVGFDGLHRNAQAGALSRLQLNFTAVDADAFHRGLFHSFAVGNTGAVHPHIGIGFLTGIYRILDVVAQLEIVPGILPKGVRRHKIVGNSHRFVVIGIDGNIGSTIHHLDLGAVFFAQCHLGIGISKIGGGFFGGVFQIHNHTAGSLGLIVGIQHLHQRIGVVTVLLDAVDLGGDHLAVGRYMGDLLLGHKGMGALPGPVHRFVLRVQHFPHLGTGISGVSGFESLYRAVEHHGVLSVFVSSRKEKLTGVAVRQFLWRFFQHRAGLGIAFYRQLQFPATGHEINAAQLARRFFVFTVAVSFSAVRCFQAHPHIVDVCVGLIHAAGQKGNVVQTFHDDVFCFTTHGNILSQQLPVGIYVKGLCCGVDHRFQFDPFSTQISSIFYRGSFLGIPSPELVGAGIAAGGFKPQKLPCAGGAAAAAFLLGTRRQGNGGLSLIGNHIQLVLHHNLPGLFTDFNVCLTGFAVAGIIEFQHVVSIHLDHGNPTAQLDPGAQFGFKILIQNNRVLLRLLGIHRQGRGNAGHSHGHGQYRTRGLFHFRIQVHQHSSFVILF